jgi:CRISPR-associated endonuclease Cas2
MQYYPFKRNQEHDEGASIEELPLSTKLEKLETWLIDQKKQKDRHMLYMVMYDIEDNRIRTQIAKYLIRKGCLRIQKSVYLAKSNRTTYQDIHQTLKEINEMYKNYDSIFVLPIPEEKFANMKVIGKNIEFELVTKSKNVLFF